jgi:hypothetical protein
LLYQSTTPEPLAVAVAVVAAVHVHLVQQTLTVTATLGAVVAEAVVAVAQALQQILLAELAAKAFILIIVQIRFTPGKTALAEVLLELA